MKRGKVKSKKETRPFRGGTLLGPERRLASSRYHGPPTLSRGLKKY